MRPPLPPRRRSPLGSTPLPEPLPQERLPPVGQLPVRALDITEELDQVLVAGLLGVLEVGGAGLGALEGMIEDADDIVLLIAGSSRVFARGYRSLLSARGRLLGSRVGPSTGGEGYVYPDGDNVRPAGRNA
jgi:hypothetical protein